MGLLDKSKASKKVAESCIENLKKLKVILLKDSENEHENQEIINKLDECREVLAKIVSRYLTKN